MSSPKSRYKNFAHFTIAKNAMALLLPPNVCERDRTDYIVFLTIEKYVREIIHTHIRPNETNATEKQKIQIFFQMRIFYKY